MNRKSPAPRGERVVESMQHSTKGTMLLRSISMFLVGSKGASSKSRSSSKQSSRVMDDQSGKVNPKMMDVLRKKTRFSKDEIEALCKIYKKLVSNCQYAARALATAPATSVIAKPHATTEGIDRIVFRELLHSTFDIITEEILMERMFCSWDKAHEGLPLRLEGWLCGLSVFLRGNIADKTAFCFRVYDLNSDGYITKDEMFTLLRNCLIKQPQDEDPDEGVKDLVEIILRKFDLDKDGRISFDDYSKTVKAEPLLIEAFGQCLPTESATLSFFATLQM
ncbi:calaxin [Condylostylus longicornis]|uniref:calaxin n=1 Tax=Condylostylus longicornis TaxID=2530218 RepID=UPI00244DBDF4|nr:calaxin [Condylostylus longicornis]